MIDEAKAKDIASKAYPDGEIRKVVDYKGLWLMSIFSDDPIEGDLDTVYSVSQSTGAFAGFPIFDEANEEALDLFTDVAHSELQHYGVKGMKWGVRKDVRGGSGPSKASVAAESVQNSLGIVKSVIPRASVLSQAQTLALLKMQGAVLSKSLVVGNMLSPANIAGYIISTADSGAYRVPGMVVKNSIRGGWPQDPKLAKFPATVEELQKNVIKQINPQYPGLGTTNNCLRATYTYEMRRRGFDVAATKTILASGQSSIGARVMSKSFKGAEKIKASRETKWYQNNAASPKDILSSLSKQPNGSRGDLQMSWGFMMGGHSVAYEVIKGKAVVFDTQSGKTYTNPQQLQKLTGKARGVKFNRLDNKNLNQAFMTAWVKDSAAARHYEEAMDILMHYISD